MSTNNSREVANQQLRILGVIPARGGSIGVPNKNLQEVGGQSLVSRAIQSSKESRYLTRIIVSTDNISIAKESEKNGLLVPRLRPKRLSTSSTQSLPVVRYELLHAEEEAGVKYDAVMLLQPTTPFRSASDIDAAVEMFTRTKCDSVVSVSEVGGNHPLRMKRLVGDVLINYVDTGEEDMRPRQELPKVYIRNGAIYLTRREVLMNENSLVGPDCLGLVMDSRSSINIDTEADLVLARHFANQD